MREREENGVKQLFLFFNRQLFMLRHISIGCKVLMIDYNATL